MTLRRIPRHLSPVRLTGGKSGVLNILHQHLPTQFEEYREPFIGAGSMALSVMWRNKDAKYWINDADRGTYCFWNNLHRYPTKMQKWVKRQREEHPTSESCEDLYNWCRSNLETADNFESGCIWFILNRLCFCGNGCFMDDKHFTENSIVKLKWCGELLQSVDLTVTNYDYSVLLSSSPRKTTVFIDPPYQLGSTYWYGPLHRNFDHLVCSYLIQDCPHQWMLTYNDIPEIRERFEGFNTTQFTLTYTMQKGNKIGRQLLIKNY